MPETEVLTPSPARNSILPPKATDPWVELSSVNLIEELLNDEFPTLDNVLLEASIVLLVKVCEAVFNVIALLLDKSDYAIVILPVPSNDTPCIVLEVSSAVAVAALPVISPTVNVRS